MSAINQKVAPERWPEWYMERRIDPIESGRRLEAFLRMREAPYFKAVQAWLFQGQKHDATGQQGWRVSLRRGWEEMYSAASVSSAIH